MSKTIDERVVSMKFNNENFEKNVAQSMSTLDKLKEKLSFKGASKGIDELNGAMRKFDASPITGALDFVGGKFSALEQMAIGAFRNIGAQITNTIEQTVKSMSGIENMAAGWSKFGNKTTAVTTLVAQGFDLEEVNEQMEKLNWFTDETSYNFVDMVGNIGKFTASGQGLQDSVNAMMGIANWAALSGQNATKASQAMYQLSQAMSKGALKYDDWKSIQNASMDTKEFREMAAGAAIELGSMVKVGDDAYKVVYENDKGVKELSEDVYTLNDLFTSDGLTKIQWLDTDVMMNVFNTYGKATKALKTLVDEEWNGVETASSAMEELEKKARKVADAMIASGQDITEEEAFDQALQKVTFEAIGNIDSVKTEVEEYRKNVEETTGKQISFNDALIELGYDMDGFALKALKAAQQARTWEDVVDSVKDAVSTGWMNIFEKIIGDQQEAVNLMTRLANDFWDIFAAPVKDKKNVFAVWRDWMEPQIRDMKGIPSDIAKMLKDNNTINGRDLLFSTEEGNLGAVVSLLKTLKDLLGIIRDAWNETFYGTKDADEIVQKKADTLMAITKALKSFADAIAIDDKKADKLRRTFKGLFAIIDIIGTFVKSAFIGIWNGLSKVFGGVSIDITDMTSNIGDGISAFRDWIKENDIFTKAFEKIGDGIGTAIGWIKDFIDYVSSIPWVVDIINRLQIGFSTSAEYVREFFDRIIKGEKAGDVLGDFVDRLARTSDLVKGIVDFFNGIKDFFSNFFSGFSLEKFDPGNIFSGIKKAFDNAQNGVEDFWSGLKPTLDTIKLYIDGFIHAVLDMLGDLNAEKIAKLIGAGILFTLIVKIISVIKIVSDAVKSFGDIGENISSAVKKISTAFSDATSRISKAISKNLNARSFKIISESLLAIVAAIGILFIMAKNDAPALITAATIIGIMTLALAGLVGVLGKVNGIYRASFVIGAIALSLMALVIAIKLLSEIQNGWNTVGIIAVLAGIISFMTLLGVYVVSKMDSITRMGLAKKIRSLAELVIGMTGGILILAVAVKMLSDIDSKSLRRAVVVIAELAGIIVAMTIIGNLMIKANNGISGIGKMMLGIAVSLIIIAGAIKLFSMIKEETFKAGFERIKWIGVLFGALIAVSFLAGEHGSSAGSMIFKMSIAFIAMVGVIALVNLLDEDAIKKGLSVIVAFSAICAALIVVAKLGNGSVDKVGGVLISVAVAITILTGVIWALSFLSVGDLAKSVAAVSVMMILFGGLIAVTKLAAKTKNLKGTLIVMTAAIAVLAAAVGALALIDQTGDVIKAAAAMAIVLGVFALVIAATKFAGKALGTLIVLTAAIAVIGVVLALMSSSTDKADGAMKSAVAIGVLLAAMSVALKLIQNISPKVIVGILGLSALTLLAWWISTFTSQMAKDNIDGVKALKNVAAILALMAGMSLVLIILQAVKSPTVLLGIVSLAAMTLLAWWISTFTSQMAKDDIDGDKALKNVVAILALMAGMSLVVIILQAVASPTVLLGIVSLAAMTLLAWWISTFTSQMAKDDIDGDKALKNVEAILALLSGMALVLLELNLTGPLVIVGIAAMALMTLIAWWISSFISQMAQNVDGENALKNAEAIAVLIESMSRSLLLLSMAGVLLTPALGGIMALLALTSGLFFVLKQIGQLVTEMPEVEEFIDKGIPILEKLATAIGSFFGNIIAGFIDAIAEGVFQIFPIIGANLSEFAVAMIPFISVMTAIPQNVMPNVESLAKAILLLTAAEFINGIANFFTSFGNEDGMTKFAGSLKAIGKGIADFSTEVNGNIYPDEIDMAVAALNQLVALSASVDILQTLGGTLGLDSLSSNLWLIGSGIAQFSTAVNGKMYPQPMTQAITQLGSLVRLGEDINFLGLLGGTLALDAFSTNLGHIGDGVAAFSVAVNGKGSPMYTEVAVTALGRLVTIGKDLDAIKGISSATGLNLFAGNLENIADGIVKFSKKVEGQMSKNDVDTSISVMERLSSVSLGFGFIDSIAHLTELELFSLNLPIIGESISKFSTKIKGKMDQDEINTAIGVIESFAALGNELTGGNGFGFIQSIINLGEIDAFALSLPIIGEGIAKFSSKISGSLGQTVIKESVNNAIGIIKSLSEIQNDVSGGTSPWDFVDTITGLGSLTLFSTNLPYLAKGIAGFANELKSAGYIGSNSGSTATEAITALASMNTLLEEVSENSKIDSYITALNNYADSIKELGEILKEVYTAADDYDLDKLKNVTSSLDEMNKIAEKSNSIHGGKGFNVGDIATSIPSNIDVSNYEDYINQFRHGNTGIDVSSYESLISDATSQLKIPDLGIGAGNDYISGFMSSITNGGGSTGVGGGLVEKISSVFEGMNLSSIGMDVGNGFGGGIFDGIINFFSGDSGERSEGVTEAINAITGAFSDSKSEENLQAVGKQIGNSVITGYKTSYADMAQAGTFSIEGLVSAIKAMAPQAQAAGEEIAKSLTNGLTLSLEIASPSKVMYGLGEFAGEGFINALTDYVSVSNTVGSDIGLSATDGIKDALERSASAFDTSVDIEPAIKPVLDLSSINQGVGEIDKMFETDRSVSLAGTVNAAMSGGDMNIQNRIDVNNDDVIKTLNDLRTDMGVMANKLSKFQVILDTGVMVGALTDPLDKSLGSRAIHSGRG